MASYFLREVGGGVGREGARVTPNLENLDESASKRSSFIYYAGSEPCRPWRRETLSPSPFIISLFCQVDLRTAAQAQILQVPDRITNYALSPETCICTFDGRTGQPTNQTTHTSPHRSTVQIEGEPEWLAIGYQGVSIMIV